MDNENKCCGTCYWHKKVCGEFQCFNEHAEGFALETQYDDGEDCNPREVLEELARLPAVMIAHPGQRKLDAWRAAIKAVKKDVPKPLKQKTDAFGDTTMVCPNCESAAVINPYRKGRELYPHCPWCGQKLKEESEA